MRPGWLIGGAVAVLVVAGAVGLAVVAQGDGGGGVPTTAAAPTSPPPTSPVPPVPDLSAPGLSLPDFSVPVLTGPVVTPAPTVVPPPGAGPDGLGTDAALDVLAEECYAGEMQSCDDLYAESPAGSAYETYGDTCAQRQPESTRRYCTDAFPG